MDILLISRWAKSVDNRGGLKIGSKRPLYCFTGPPSRSYIINSLDLEDRQKISAMAQVDLDKAREARRLELEGDYKASISKWQEVFGSDFPGYESQ